MEVYEMNSWVSGEIVINDEIVLGPNLSEETLTHSTFYRRYFHSNRILNSEGMWLYFNNVPLLGRSFFVSTYYNNNTLKHIELGLSDPIFPTSWEGWTEQAELKRHRMQLQLLKQHLQIKPTTTQKHPYPYEQYDFDWGDIIAYYDPRSGSASIAFRYRFINHSST